MVSRTLALAVLFAAALGPASAQEMRNFKAWHVVCDNGRACAALGTQTDGGETALVIRRAPEGSAAPTFILVVGLDPRTDAAFVQGRVLELRVPGEPPLAAVIGRDLVRGELDDNLVEIRSPTHVAFVRNALRRAPGLTIAVQGGDPLGTIDLDGASAALLFMDDQQRRVGTETALARPGPRRARDVPPPPPLPVAPATRRLPTEPEPQMTPDLREALLNHARECDNEPDVVISQAWMSRLDNGQVLVALACDNAAYNFTHEFVMWREGSSPPQLTPVTFPQPEMAGGPSSALVNADFDPATGVMFSFAKGRGIGDCGTQAEWRWTGDRFALVQFRTMPMCRGLMLPEWFSLFRSREP